MREFSHPKIPGKSLRLYRDTYHLVRKHFRFGKRAESHGLKTTMVMSEPAKLPLASVSNQERCPYLSFQINRLEPAVEYVCAYIYVKFQHASFRTDSSMATLDPKDEN